MTRRHWILGGVGLGLIGLVGFGGWLWSLPDDASVIDAPPVPSAEMRAAIAALKPPKRERPLITVVGINGGTEATDYLMPTGILRRADVADVQLLASKAGPVQLYPALRVEADSTISSFDAQHPKGADFVIVPAMHRDDDPQIIAWLQQQSRKGAMIIAICAGAKVAATAGLLHGRRATTHWYYLPQLRKIDPTIQYVADRRIVVERGIATTTGISASMPMMLTLIEAIAGAKKAQQVAQGLGLVSWDISHPSSAFQLTRPFATTVLGNMFAFWNRDQIGIELKPGMDEVSLALASDAWSRTYRSSAFTYARSAQIIETKSHIRVIPDRFDSQAAEIRLPDSSGLKAAESLDRVLRDIRRIYGAPTAKIVAMQLEYRDNAPAIRHGATAAVLR